MKDRRSKKTKDEKDLEYNTAFVKYLENKDKESLSFLRKKLFTFYIFTIPISIIIVCVVLGIPLTLLGTGLKNAMIISGALVGIPEILTFIISLLCPALEDESLYIGIAWIIFAALISNAYNMEVAFVISTLTMIIFSMLIFNNSKEKKIQNAKAKIYRIENK